MELEVGPMGVQRMIMLLFLGRANGPQRLPQGLLLSTTACQDKVREAAINNKVRGCHSPTYGSLLSSTSGQSSLARRLADWSWEPPAACQSRGLAPATECVVKRSRRSSSAFATSREGHRSPRSGQEVMIRNGRRLRKPSTKWVAQRFNRVQFINAGAAQKWSAAAELKARMLCPTQTG